MLKLNTGTRLAVNRSVLILTLIFALQIAGSLALSVREDTLEPPNLRTLPSKIGDWTMIEEQAMEPAVVAYLRPADYIMRSYRTASVQAPIGLFVAYFTSLQSTYGPHSPRVCLPGSGWLTRAGATVNIPIPGRASAIPINKYLMEKDRQRIVVLYWYQNNRRAWADEIQSKVYLLPDLLRYRRSDVSLIRTVLPIESGVDIEFGYKSSIDFVQQLFPSLVERLGTVEGGALETNMDRRQP